MSGINELNLRNDVYEDEIPQELPEQGGSYVPQLKPGQYWLVIPATIAQLWAAFDQTKDVLTGQPLAKPIQRLQLKFDKDNPLVVRGGDQDGAVLLQTISNMPRKRSKKADVPPVSDMLYLVRESLAVPATVPLRTPQDWINCLNQFAGQVFPAETGLQGQCRKDKVKWIPDGQGGQIEDPTGAMGCGKRYYSQSFKLPDGTYAERLQCQTPGCGAIIRGFAQIDRFLKRPA
jgi:hypothetical protein